jgi:diacylglycerol kinase family enzyme
MVRRLLLVANPSASGFTASLHREVVAVLQNAFDVLPVWPNGPMEAQEVAAGAAEEGWDVVLAMGGDGVVHRVANGIAGSATALAVVPAGTTNVFARIVGYPRSGRRAAQALGGETAIRRLPTLVVTTAVAGERQTMRAVFAAGVGFDADVIRESERRPLRKVGFGSIHYARSSTRVALSSYRRKRPDLRVEVDGVEVDAVTAVAQLHRHYTYLGRRALTLHPEGGPVAMTIEKASPRRLVALLVRSALHRDPGRVWGVQTHRPFSEMLITAQGTAPFEADGEFLGDVESARIRLDPESLLVMSPQEA